MKLLHLVFRQYSEYFLRETVIIILAAYLIYALTTAISPIAYTLSLTDKIESSIQQSAIYFSPYDRVSRLIDGILGRSAEDRELLESKLNENLLGLKGVVGQGKTGEITFSNEDQSVVRLILYNEDMIKYTTLPLAEGDWFNSYHIDDDSIPVIIGGSYRHRYNLGDVFTVNLKEKYKESIKCKVIAVLDDRDIYFMLGYGATSPILDSLAVMNKWTYSRLNKNEDSLLIVPQNSMGFTDINDVSRGTLLFFDEKTDVESMASELESKGEYGHFVSIKAIAENQMKDDLSKYNDQIVLSIVLFLFSVLGLGGYTLLSHFRNEYATGIYFLCGMSRKKAVFINLSATFILILIPTMTMTLLAPKYVQYGAGLNILTYIGCLFSVIVILIVSNIISIWRVFKYNPAELSKMEG